MVSNWKSHPLLLIVLHFFYAWYKAKDQKHKWGHIAKWHETPSVTLEREWATLLYSGFVGGGGPDCPHLQLRRGMGRGFHRTIGFPSSLFKKFWALRDGILVVRKVGIAKLSVDVDAMEVVSIACSCHVPNFFFFFDN